MKAAESSLRDVLLKRKKCTEDCDAAMGNNMLGFYFLISFLPVSALSISFKGLFFFVWSGRIVSRTL